MASSKGTRECLESFEKEKAKDESPREKPRKKGTAKLESKAAKYVPEEKELKSSMPLVQFSSFTRQLVINKEATDLLRAIHQPVAVLGMCGPYRSGKSYFMSRLMGSNDFKVSHSMDACTKGIWISTSVKTLEHCTIVALDTEGIGAAQASEASSKEEVMKYLIITTLLCSYLIYNAKGAIEDSHLQQMSCFGELSHSVLISDSLKDDDKHRSCLKKHFPDFLWLIRDCDLAFKSDTGEELSATEYLFERVLVMDNTSGTGMSTRDRTVNSILTVFPKIECYKVSSPGPGISNSKKKIDPDFLPEIDRAIDHVLSNIKEKFAGFNETIAINGPMLASLLEHYVDALNTPGSIPNLEVSYWTAVDTTITNSIREMSEKYNKQMSTLVDPHLPMEEGDLAGFLSELNARIKEASQRALETVDPPVSISKEDTLLEIHGRVFNFYLTILSVELHKLIPNAPTSDEKVETDIMKRKIRFLRQFCRIVVIANRGKVSGGYLAHFISSNQEKSENMCKETFEKIYKLQLESGVSLNQLETEYYRRAIGPQKDIVFQQLYSEIPGGPEMLSIHSETDQTVRITWKKSEIHPDAVTRFEVQWYMKGDNVKMETVNDCEYKLQSCKPRTTYVVKVRGINIHKGRFGEYSEKLVFETKAWRPDMPDTITVSPETDITARLGVTMLPVLKENGSHVTHIHVSRHSDLSSNWETQRVPVDPAKGEHQFLTVQTHCENNEKTLWFRIQFENEAGLSEPSKSVQLNVEDMIPGKPDNIKCISKAREILLTWDPPKTNPGSVKSYHIQYWEKQKTTYRSDKMTNHVDNSLTIDGLTPNTDYSIRIYTSNINNKYSKYSTLTVRTQAGAPDKPQLQKVKALSATKARLTFCRQHPDEENGSEVTAVIIEQRLRTETTGLTPWTQLRKQPIDVNQDDSLNIDIEFEIDSLTSRATMCFHIQTVNSVGESEPSRVVELRPENVFPGKPDQLQASDTKTDSIKISWKPPKENLLVVDKFQLQYKAADEGAWISKKIDSDTYSNTVSELKPNTQYKFLLQAMNGYLASEESHLDISTPPSVPPKPRPPIAIPQEQMSLLQIVLPAVEESGKEVSKLHVHHYKSMRDKAPFKTEDFEIDLARIMVNERARHYEQQIKVNIDETRGISIRLSNEVGRSEESDLIGLSFGDVTPGVPDELTYEAESRKIHLFWKVPQTNGNAAKYYEVQIKENDKWETQQNCTVLQQRSEETLSYHAIVHDLNPYTFFRFGVQAVNNTTKNILVGGRATIDTETSKSAPEKPSYPTVELIDEKTAEVVIALLSEEKINGSCVNKASLKCNDEELMVIDITQEELTRESLKRIISIPNFTDPNITTYCFQVQMINEVGASEPSDSFPLPVSQIKPGPPLNLEVTQISAHSMKVTWETPEVNPALVTQYYLVYYQRGLKEYKKELYTIENEHEICGLQSGREHTIKVIAIATKTNRSKPAKMRQSTQEIYPGPPTTLYVDKIGSNECKIRWRKPKEHPLEVVFYFIQVRKGEDHKPVERTKRVMGTSTVLEGLDSYTTYTVSVSPCNDNKIHSEDSTVHVKFNTIMSKTAKKILQVLAVPSVAGPFVLGYSQSPDEHMEESDDEYPASPGVYPGPPEDMTVELSAGYLFDVKWTPPRRNFDELYYYKISVSRTNKSAKQFKRYYPQRSFRLIFEPGIEYTIRVTSINYADEEDPNGATLTLTKVINDRSQSMLGDIQSLL